jgi:glycosyltransferase involved in cell wall biosynthesis
MLQVLISSPSIDVEKNVSGVSSVAVQIMGVLSGKVEFRHLEIGSEQRGGRFARLFGSLTKAARAIITVLTSRFDILHSNTALNPKSIVRDLAVIAAARLRGKAVVLHVHGGTFIHEQPAGMLRSLMRQMFRMAGGIVVLSRTQLSYFAAHYPETAGKTEFIYNGIGMDGEPARTVRETAPGERLKAVFAGRLAHDKGLDVLLPACRRLDDRDGIDVHVFGTGDLLPGVLALAQEKPFVKYRGVFQPSESRAVLQDFDALVITSSREGLPMALIEAMSAGTVPICPESSSFPELVKNGETGLLIKPDSPDAIAEALLRLKQDAEGRRSMGNAAHEFAAANFDARKNFAKFLGIYQRLCPQAGS